MNYAHCSNRLVEVMRASKAFNIPEAVYLYDEGIKDLKFKEIKGFIRDNFGKIRAYLIKLEKGIVQTKGLVFDFLATRENFENLNYSRIKNACHIILTKKLFATPDEDRRLHIRSSIYSLPSVISLSGIVEGPAKCKDFYFYKQKYSQLGVWETEEPKIKRKFKGLFIDYEDKRITEVLKGYVAQAIFFYITGEPFCRMRNCRLYNAHWQKDLIYAQLECAGFCARHKKILKGINTLLKESS